MMGQIGIMEAILPLDTLIREYGFTVKKEKNFEGSFREVRFIRQDDLEVRYRFLMYEASGRKHGSSKTSFELFAKLIYGKHDVVPLYNWGIISGMPITEEISKIIDKEIKPKLDEILL